MKNLVFTLSLFCVFSAIAGIERGIYVGQDQQGEECSAEIVMVVYRDGVHSPFNEVVISRVHSSHLVFDLRHKGKLDGQTLAMDGHDLTDIKTGPRGHEYLKVVHGHVDGRGVVTGFSYVLNNSKTGESKNIECSEMKKRD